MKKNKSIAVLGLFAALCLAMLNGCETKKEDIKESGTETEVPQTEPVIVTKVTYTPPDEGFTLILPNSSWKKTRNENGVTTFALEDEAEITITHRSGKAVKELLASSKEARLVKKLAKNGFDTENIELKDFIYEKNQPVTHCRYILNYKQNPQGNVYGIAEVFFSDKEGYQVFATAKSDNPELIEELNETVATFKLEKELTGDETETQSEAGQSETGSKEERYFFDKDGNAVYTTQNEKGEWTDKNGKVYTFHEDGVKDQDGVQYYYDPVPYRESETAKETSKKKKKEPEYYDFYDKDGNYIKATKDKHGNWVGEDGKTYVFGEDGVTDSDGNFHPY